MIRNTIRKTEILSYNLLETIASRIRARSRNARHNGSKTITPTIIIKFQGKASLRDSEVKLLARLIYPVLRIV